MADAEIEIFASGKKSFSVDFAADETVKTISIKPDFSKNAIMPLINRLHLAIPNWTNNVTLDVAFTDSEDGNDKVLDNMYTAEARNQSDAQLTDMDIPVGGEVICTLTLSGAPGNAGSIDGTLYSSFSRGGNSSSGNAVQWEGSGYIDFDSIAAPGNPDAGTLRLYNESGAFNVRNAAGTVINLLTDAIGANAALSNLSSVAINTALVSDTDDTDDLGTSSIGWRSLYLSSSILGTVADGANTALTFGNSTALTTAGGKIASFTSDAGVTERAYIDYLGKYVGSAVRADAGSAAAPSIAIGADGTGIYGGSVIDFAIGGSNAGRIESGLMRFAEYRPRSVASLKLNGLYQDSTTAVAAKIGNVYSLSTTGAKIASFFSDNFITERAYINYLGKIAAYGGLSAESSTGGGEARKHSEATVTLSGASSTCHVNVPIGAKITGWQYNTETAVISGDGATSLDIAFSGGSTTNLATGQAFAQNTKDGALITPEIISSEADIAVTPDSGTFSGGVLRFIVYYSEITALADVA